jgi:DNA-binding MarR family transcriptional regulator
MSRLTEILMSPKPDLARDTPVTHSLTDTEEGLVAPALMITANLIRRGGNLTYKSQLGLSAIEWALIARLGRGGPMTPTALSDLSLYDKGQISRASALLESKRLISRQELTWRSVELSLTPSGTKLFGKIMRISRQRHEAITKNIGERELQQFYKTLNTIAANASELLASLKSDDTQDE